MRPLPQTRPNAEGPVVDRYGARRHKTARARLTPRQKPSICAAFGPMAEWLRRGLQILAPEFDSRSGLHLLEIPDFPATRWLARQVDGASARLIDPERDIDPKPHHPDRHHGQKSQRDGRSDRNREIDVTVRRHRIGFQSPNNRSRLSATFGMPTMVYSEHA